MNKLQRYSWMDIGGMSTKGRDDARWCAADEVSALEAENERLREELKELIGKWHSFPGAHFGVHAAVAYASCIEDLEAILNREHEKL